MQRLKDYLPHLPIVPYVAIITPAGRHVDYVGPSVRHLLGYTPDDFTVAMNAISAYMHADDVDHAQICLVDINQESYACEYRFRHAEGHYVWLADAGRVVQKGEGEPAYLVGSLMDITQRKQAEREIHLTRERFKRALEGTNIVITEQDTSLKYQWVFNPQDGFQDQTVIERRASDFLDEEQSAAVDALKTRAIVTGTEQKQHMRFTLPNGNNPVVEMHVKPRLGADGTVDGVTTVSYVVTELHDLQEKLRTSRDRILFVLEDSPITLAIQDRDGRYLWVEQNKLGIPDEDIIGKTDYDLFPEDFADAITRFRQEVIETKVASRIDLPVQMPTGTRWYMLRAQPTLDDEGHVKEVAFISVDNTEQIERESQFKLLAENSRDMICLHAPDGTYQYISPAVEDLLGYTPQELIGTDPYQLFHPEDRDWIHHDAHQHALEGEEPPKITYRIRQKSGGYIWFETITQGVVDGNGEVTGLVTTSRDVTKTVRLAHQLEERQQKLEESNKDLEQFAYVASHDLQEPLRAVTGYLNLLRQLYSDDLNEEALDFVQEAVDGSDRMRQLINGLLEYSRVNRKNQPFASVSIEAVLEDVWANLHAITQEHDLQITQDPMPSIAVDKVQMSRVFQNLLTNAVKFADKSPVIIHIGAMEKRTCWQFCVSDNGIGIDKDYHERIFKIFQRLHTRDEIAGSGIGLAVVRKIIERHGGEIWVESHPGEGSIFYFTIRKGLGERATL